MCTFNQGIVVFFTVAFSLCGSLLLPNPVLPYPFITVKPQPLDVPELIVERSIMFQNVLDHAYGIAAGSPGNVFVSMENGTIVQLKITQPPHVVDTYHIDAVPFGMRFDAANQRLLVAAGDRGVLAVDVMTGSVRTLASTVAGNQLKCVLDIEIMSDGKVYFIECSNKFTYNESWYDLLESRSNGQVMSLNTKTLATSITFEKLYHPVSLTSVDDKLIISEAGHYNYKVIELSKGGRKAVLTVTKENIPAFSGGIVADPESDLVYMALPAQRHPFLDRIHASPIIKMFAARFPKVLLPPHFPHNTILVMNENGNYKYKISSVSPSDDSFLTSMVVVDNKLVVVDHAYHGLIVLKLPKM